MSKTMICEETKDGYTLALTSKLGHILQEAEQKYGLRDHSYTILGIEFNDAGPMIRYPGNCKNIAIQLNTSCLDNFNRGIFQLAHEIIHCLFPTGKRNANVLEEGLATYFAGNYARENGYGEWSPNEDKYKIAYYFFCKLIEIDKDIIQKLRKINPTISLITKDDIMKANDKIPEKLIDELIKPFYT